MTGRRGKIAGVKCQPLQGQAITADVKKTVNEGSTKQAGNMLTGSAVMPTGPVAERTPGKLLETGGRMKQTTGGRMVTGAAEVSTWAVIGSAVGEGVEAGDLAATGMVGTAETTGCQMTGNDGL